MASSWRSLIKEKIQSVISRDREIKVEFMEDDNLQEID